MERLVPIIFFLKSERYQIRSRKRADITRIRIYCFPPQHQLVLIFIGSLAFIMAAVFIETTSKAN